MTLPLGEPWFERRRIDPDLTLIFEPHVDPLLRCNIWHLRGRDADLLVDTGLGVSSLRQAARDLFDKPLLAVATHVHLDHAGGLHEFDHRLVHADEAADLRAGAGTFALTDAGYPPALRSALDGYPLPLQGLLTAAPHAGFDPAAFRQIGCDPTRVLAEGDLIDLGDRALEVLHLPGHSPGSIGLWEAATGTLFSGDAIYDGPLLDRLPGSDRALYRATMERLLRLPVAVVHAGHEASFGRERLLEIAGAYLG